MNGAIIVEMEVIGSRSSPGDPPRSYWPRSVILPFILVHDNSVLWGVETVAVARTIKRI
jgi:hypothetical protein